MTDETEEMQAAVDDAVATLDDETDVQPAATAEDVEVDPQTAALMFWAGYFVSLAEDSAEALLEIGGIDELTQRNAIANALNTIGATAMRAATAIAAWLEGAPADEPAIVGALADPGDLTCPRCDGPIPLGQLQDVGICATCEAREQADFVEPQESADAEAVG